MTWSARVSCDSEPFWPLSYSPINPKPEWMRGMSAGHSAAMINSRLKPTVDCDRCGEPPERDAAPARPRLPRRVPDGVRARRGTPAPRVRLSRRWRLRRYWRRARHRDRARAARPARKSFSFGRVRIDGDARGPCRSAPPVQGSRRPRRVSRQMPDSPFPEPATHSLPGRSRPRAGRRGWWRARRHRSRHRRRRRRSWPG